MTRPRLRTDGCYHTGPVDWEEWHAGVHMRETQYHFWRFYPNGIWVCCHRSEPDFAFWDFTESPTSRAIDSGRRWGSGLTEDGMELFVAGTHQLDGAALTTVHERRIPLSPSGAQVLRYQTRWELRGEVVVPRDPTPGLSPLYFADRPAVGT